LATIHLAIPIDIQLGISASAQTRLHLAKVIRTFVFQRFGGESPWLHSDDTVVSHKYNGLAVAYELLLKLTEGVRRNIEC
jgi:hypothetical protein